MFDFKLKFWSVKIGMFFYRNYEGILERDGESGLWWGWEKWVV